ncbi:phosphotransferase [uncultured Bradyrhizobium sp.]|uniref:phosphotransferase n=1 Tax=uncultured Bradyrhizobium sp. TaxID=199684 RepID=UPI00262219EE|nr:phosphotransferase [uncultured Bradyrhizobium sp.]
MKAAFPVSLGEVDPAWLTDVLRANRLIAQGEKVDGFEATPIGLGFGQTGESARLTLRYARSETSTKAPASLFAKFATTDPVRRKASRAIGLYQREVNFYNVLVKAASVRAPACYFAETTGEGEFFALLLEDFPNHRPGDETVGLKVEEARLAIDLMAQLHGPYWGKMAKVDLAPLVMPARDRYVVAWNEMEARFGEHVPDRFREAREAYLDAIVPLQRWLTSQPSTLGHGDLRLDNLLFGQDGNDPIVAVDWQAVRPSKGMRDFAYLVSHSMNADDRRANELELLRRYVERIGSFGVRYSFEDAREDYRKAMLFDFCTVLYIVGININTHERALRRKHALMTRAVTAMLDWNVLDLLPAFR